MWRWDQGRLTYFQFDVLKKIAKVLVKFDGIDVSNCESLFRRTLVEKTGMPFLPTDYTIKRNYARVFQSSLLACFKNNTLIVTDVCRKLSKDDGIFLTADDYFLFFAAHFRFPFPAFEKYNIQEQRTYPFCAMIKFLFAQRKIGVEAKLSVREVFEFLIANHCTGYEDLEYYQTLLPGVCEEQNDPRRQRQVREMMAVISQLSFLKMTERCLWLDTIGEDVQDELLKNALSPEVRMAEVDSADELLKMTVCTETIWRPKLEVLPANSEDLEFVEGDRRRVEHFRIERSGLLRKYYKQAHPEAVCCACKQKMKNRYPWTDYMLDIHHLLPLSSAVAISTKGTSMEDIVGLCPSCHRAVHLYYKKWLKEKQQKDFATKQEARKVYREATEEIAS